MKKLALLISLMFCMICSFASDATFEAEVVSASGKVEMLKNEQWVALKQGDKIQQGTVIQTGFKSELTLKVKETIVNVSPLTRMEVEKLVAQESKDDTKLYVATGSVKSDVRKAGNRKVGFTVRSPVATASVRGTVVTMANHYMTSNVMTERGVVAVWENDSVKDSAPASKTENAEILVKEQAPKGSFTVTKSQAASFTSSGNVKNAQTVAQQNSTSLGASTVSAAISEVANVASSSTASSPATNASVSAVVPEVSNKGSLNISVTFPE